jgi:hypothetical protein
MAIPKLMNRRLTMSNTPDTLSEMISLLESVRNDYDKFYDGGNNSAGTRVRKAMQEVKASAQEVRLHVQATKNG